MRREQLRPRQRGQRAAAGRRLPLGHDGSAGSAGSVEGGGSSLIVRCARGLVCVGLPGLLIGFPVAAAVTVSLPASAGAPPAQSTSVPVDISDATGLLATDLVILYDPAVAAATSVSRTALSSGQTLVANLGVPGSIRISLFGVAPLAGGGAILTIDFTSIGPGGDGTTLHIDTLQLNEGQIPAERVDGAWCVQAPAREVQDLEFPWAASPAGEATLAWPAAPWAVAYNVYRADRADLSDAVCLLQDLPGTTAGDGGGMPAPGAVHFFVVTSRNCSGESTAGWSSAGVERVLPQRCP